MLKKIFKRKQQGRSIAEENDPTLAAGTERDEKQDEGGSIEEDTGDEPGISTGIGDYLAVIAIDFGTTFSGYAFSMKSSPNDITMNKNWGADAGFRGYKTPTSILLRPDGSTHSFGFQAENEFSDLDEDERKEGYLLFQRFKMELFKHQAGLVEDILSPNLIIALEPEAASLYCRTLALEKFVGMTSKKGDMSIKPGDRYIIVDCGGGTIDITVHEVTKDGKIQEVTCASGGPWGGIYVDKKYYQLLDEIFGTDFMNHLKRDHPSTWMAMLIDFETKKRGANPENVTGISMNVSHQFAKLFERYSGQDLEERIKKRKKLGVKFSNGMLRVTRDSLQNMYAEVIPNIRAHIRQLLHENSDQNISKMFVVGGFAESAYLQEFITSEFGRDVKIYIPEEAGMCVMKGAVLFGHNTRYISSRIARVNYGIVVAHVFDKSEHDINKKKVSFDREWIMKLLVLIHKGQRINCSDVVSLPSHMRKGQESATARLVCAETDTDDPEHPSVTLLETIKITNPNIEKEYRDVTISLQFGGTDILMKVVDHDTGKEVQAKVQF